MLVITITHELTFVCGKEYDYSKYDRILKNIMTDEYEVFYSGQKQGGLDYQLIDSVQNNERVKIYYRAKKTKSFTYLGETSQSDIVQYRKIPKGRGNNASDDERLQIHLVIPKENVKNTTLPTTFQGTGKYKKAVFTHAGLPLHSPVTIGFYKTNQ